MKKFYILRDDITVYCGDKECLYPNWGSTIYRSLATTWSNASEVAQALTKLSVNNKVCVVEFSDEKTCLFQSCEGEVVHTSDDQVVIVMAVDGDLVEQAYSMSQFIGGQAPQKGDMLEIRVQFIKLDRPESTQLDQTREPRKNTVPLPRTF
jgi:ribosomal protein S1